MTSGSGICKPVIFKIVLSISISSLSFAILSFHELGVSFILTQRGNVIRDLSNFISEWNDSFEFKFIPPEKLVQREKEVFDITKILAELVGGLPSKVQSVKISETMRSEAGSFSEALGLWTGTEIIIKRSELTSIERYASTLLHEIAHAKSGESDVSRGFEKELTNYLGKIASKALQKASNTSQLSKGSLPQRHYKEAIPPVEQAPRNSSAPKKVGFWARFFRNK